MKRKCRIQTPLGEMDALVECDALSGLWFVGQKYAPKDLGGWMEDSDHPVFVALRSQLASYFDGELRSFDLPLSPKGTPFQMALWALLRTIPSGETTTYGALARQLGAERESPTPSAQAVGGAVGRNPLSIIIPCHRVVGTNGSLTGYAGGLDRKAALLALEKGEDPTFRNWGVRAELVSARQKAAGCLVQPFEGGERGMLNKIQGQLVTLSNPEDALFLQRYFKTGPGEYGEGDIFRGIRVPVLRRLSKENQDIPLELVERLLRSDYHEERFLALLILVHRYARGDKAVRTDIYDSYLGHTRFINSWDLVDLSSEQIVGAYLAEKSKAPLYQLARSSSLWERRIAILATFHYIKRGIFDETLAIAGMLLSDSEDLIHKAVGWMLREVGKRDLQREELFLAIHYNQMPRTMLRYAIEKFPLDKRLGYLKGTV